MAVVGNGIKKPEDIAEIMASKTSSDNTPPAPAQGLFLQQVYYEADDSGHFEFDVAKLASECNASLFN
jgi:tRNA U38,U39,U40 pseudouridine synthase TruA